MNPIHALNFKPCTILSFSYVRCSGYDYRICFFSSYHDAIKKQAKKRYSDREPGEAIPVCFLQLRKKLIKMEKQAAAADGENDFLRRLHYCTKILLKSWIQNYKIKVPMFVQLFNLSFPDNFRMQFFLLTTHRFELILWTKFEKPFRDCTIFHRHQKSRFKQRGKKKPNKVMHITMENGA